MITIDRTSRLLTAPTQYIYTCLYIYEDAIGRTTDTTSVFELNLSDFPPKAVDFIESYYSVRGGLSHLITRSVPTGTLESYLAAIDSRSDWHYLCLDSYDVDVVKPISAILDGSDKLLVLATSQEIIDAVLGHKNTLAFRQDPEVDDPCAGATTNIIIDVSAEYDVYINDELIVSGEYADIFEALIFTQGLVWDTSGLLTSYRDATARFRFERTDADTIDFDALDNPTATLTGNVLTFCLSGVTADQNVLFAQDLILSEPDGQDFISIAPNQTACDGKIIGTLLASSQSYLQVQYRVTQQLASGGSEHIFAAITSFLGFTLRYNFDGLLASNTLLSPQLPVGTVVTSQFSATGVTVSWLDQSVFVAHNVDADLLVLPFFGGIWSVILGNSSGLCDAVPMEIRF